MTKLCELALDIVRHAKRCGVECYFLGDYYAAHPMSESEYDNALCVWTIDKNAEILISKQRQQRKIVGINIQVLIDNIWALCNNDSVGAEALLWVNELLTNDNQSKPHGGAS